MIKRFVTFPKWAILPGVLSSILLLAALLVQRAHLAVSSTTHTTDNAVQAKGAQPDAIAPPSLGPRYELNYNQWVQQLAREANVIAQKSPEHLYILVGDSLSLWFPAELLPDSVTWLNQGISGETSYGLLRRVKLFDQTKPQTIFVMIGINDLIRGMRYETVAANHREIIRHLKAAHPKATIVVQSILPHGGDRASQRYLASVKDDPAAGQNAHPLWVKRLPVITNPSIRRLNKRLALIAEEEKVQFLDLHSRFTDAEGNLQEQLTTDGLHLSPAGYALWRSQLEPFLPTGSQATVSR